MSPVLIANEWPVNYPKYEVRVTKHGDTEVLLKAEAEVAQGSLLIAIPAKKLGAGTFDLIISGKTGDRAAEDVARYPFTIQGE